MCIRDRSETDFKSPRSFSRSPTSSPKPHQLALSPKRSSSSGGATRAAIASPRHGLQMQSADDILNRISALETDQQKLSQAAMQTKAMVEASKAEYIQEQHQQRQQVPDAVVDPDAIAAVAIEKVRQEVLEEIDSRVESTVEQDIRSVSKVLVDRVNELTVQLEHERTAHLEEQERVAEEAREFKLRLLELEREEKKRKQKDENNCCAVQ
eukprot:TRINITY_DN6436_c0_g1_i2.p1 TRINITY_DN6436_c0_g1~~TRINITY_DN6436_c0_g1_i2.p1  ORF type:complete len:210 (+),score=70.57 TRINITY_DN6436_c0_g1_i2:118-747(+)